MDKKKPPSKLTHAVRDAPANLILSQVHREVRQSEDDNVGVEAAHKVEQAVESGGRLVQSCLLYTSRCVQETVSNAYLWLSGAKSQGRKQLMAGGGVALIGITLVPLLSGLFG